MIDDCRGDELEGVGIGVPSIVEFGAGRVVSSANVPLADVPLRDVLSERVGVPVFVDNDATVAALAEAHDEQLRLVARDLVMITIGTGVGGGLVLNGRIYRGATGGAGELGHTLVGMDLSGPVPDAGRFPQPGSLEGVAAGHALDKLVARSAADEPDSALGRLHAAGTGGHRGRSGRGRQRWRRHRGAPARTVGRARRHRDRQRHQHLRSRGGRDRRRGGTRRRLDARAGAADRRRLRAPRARDTRRRFALPATVSAPGVLGAALLAVHELSDRPARSPTEVG